MEAASSEAGASADIVTSEDHPVEAEKEDRKKGSRFSRRKEKKKAAKKAKKASKHSKDKGQSDVSPDADASLTVESNAEDTGVGSLHGALAVPSDNASTERERHKSAFTPYHRQPPGAESSDHGRGTVSTSYGHSLASGASSAGNELVPKENSSSQSQQQPQESDQPDGLRAKSRSRSGSRKRLPALFRRRGRSRGGEDERRRSETDMVGVEGEAGPKRNRSAEDKKSRKSKSLDRGKSRLPASVDRYSARQSASLERDAYRRFDPAKQPRDRLQHMTVKDALLEYRYRHQPPTNRLLAVEVEGQGQRSVSDTDVSFRNEGESGGLYLDPGQATLVKTAATLPRGSRLVRETSLLGGSDGEPAESPERDTGGDDSFPRRNLGKQILDMCRTISQGPELDATDGGGAQGQSDTNSTARAHGKQSDPPRDVSSIIFINPNDIQGDANSSSAHGAEHSHMSADASQSQQKVKPSDHFMELRKVVPVYSNSTAARERRVSQAEASHVAHPNRSSQSRDSFKSSDASSASSSSKGYSSVPPNNIPVSDPGDSKVVDSSPRYSLTSPEITVNCVHIDGKSMDGKSMDTALKMDSSVTMDASMISSIDSGKRSSDQGFFSEPRESDSDSEVDMSGFSTPPEELYSEHDSARNSLSPTVFVNNANNLLEVPKARSAYKRSISDDVRKAHATGTHPASSGVDRTNSFKSDSVLTKRKHKQPVPSSLEGSMLYVQQKEELRSANEGSHEQQMNQERMDQKNVPVMGTSVQQKYRRTFSPGRNKTGEASKEEYIGSLASTIEPTVGVALAEQSKPTKMLLELPESQNVRGGGNTSGEDMEQRKLQRGRGSQKLGGYVSGRSFRRTKETEKKDPERTLKDPPTLESPTAEVIDDGIEELQHRIAFQDKSIQTSDSLLNELIKKSKKRKLKPFSSGGKKSKQKDRSPVMVQIPADLPPPRYEEERPLRQADNTDIPHVEEHIQPPLTHSPDVTDGLMKDDEEDPEIAPLLDSSETPATEEQQPTDASSKKASKPRGTSFRALVALKRKLTRNRQKKKKDLDKKAKEEAEDEEADTEENADLPSDTFITIENELNLSKLAEIKETDILDDDIIEPGFGPVFPNKELRFEPILSDEPIQSEEPLPPLSPASRRMTARRNSTRGRERRKKCLHCCKKFVAFLFSHIGLCSLVVGYTIFGGFIFQMLEGSYEMKVRNEVQEERVKVMNEIKTLATEYQLNELELDQMTTELETLLKNYQSKLFTEITDKGWDGNEYDPNAENQSEQWSFASALLYAITVMTTIGYGHVAPKTSYGRVVTIFYAVLGIPLTLLCLTNIGDVMASGFRLLYGKVCCGLCCKLFKPSRRRRRRVPDVEKGLPRQVVTTEEGEADKPKEVIQVPTSLCLLLIATYIFAGSLLFSLWEDWDFLTGSYFCFITLSTIGFGDIVPGMDVQSWSKEYKLVLSALYLIFGLSLIAMCFNLVQEDVKAKCRWLGMKIGIIDKPEPPV